MPSGGSCVTAGLIGPHGKDIMAATRPVAKAMQQHHLRLRLRLLCVAILGHPISFGIHFHDRGYCRRSLPPTQVYLLHPHHLGPRLPPGLGPRRVAILGHLVVRQRSDFGIPFLDRGSRRRSLPLTLEATQRVAKAKAKARLQQQHLRPGLRPHRVAMVRLAFSMAFHARGPRRRSLPPSARTPEAMRRVAKARLAAQHCLRPRRGARPAAFEGNSSFSAGFWTMNLLTHLFFLQAKMANPTPGDFVLAQGVRWLTLADHRFYNMPFDLLLSDLPAGQDQGTYYARRLCPEAQQLFFRSISMIDQLVMLRCLPHVLTSDKIAITLPDYRPKLKGVVFIQDPSDDHVTTIVESLAAIFCDLIRWNHPQIRLPAEVHNLLLLMCSPRTVAPRTQPDLALMRVHSCLVPMENRGELFVRLFQYIQDVLRPYSPSCYRYVIKELVFSKYWEILAGQNVYLKGLLDRHIYDPIGAQVVISQVEHLKFNRHGPCHSLQDAFDPRSPHGLRCTYSTINHAMYLSSELLIASIQSSLHYLGHLKALRTETLFSWN